MGSARGLFHRQESAARFKTVKDDGKGLKAVDVQMVESSLIDPQDTVLECPRKLAMLRLGDPDSAQLDITLAIPQRGRLGARASGPESTDE